MTFDSRLSTFQPTNATNSAEIRAAKFATNYQKDAGEKTKEAKEGAVAGLDPRTAGLVTLPVGAFSHVALVWGAVRVCLDVQEEDDDDVHVVISIHLLAEADEKDDGD